MARHNHLRFTEEERQTLARERYEYPHPRVQQRLEFIWLVSQGLTQTEAARLAGVSQATGDRYVAVYRRGGIAALREFRWRKPTSELQNHHATLEESFRVQPPHTVAEACDRIEQLTGLVRRPTQVRAFLKKLSA